MWLSCNGVTMPLSHVAPTFVIAKAPRDIAPGTTAELVVSIDGEETSNLVQLADGMRSGTPRTVIIVQARASVA